MSWISGIANAVGSVVNGIQQRNAAQKASSALQKGAQDAQALEKQNQDAANAAQQTALSNVTTAEQPYQTLGSTSANHLADLVAKGFTAPTLAEAEQTPGFKFNLETGTNAINENAAATGTLMSGNTGVALQKFGQGLAENTYQQDYQNALNTYMSNYQSMLGGTNAGLTSTGQLEGANLTTAGNTANIDMTAAEQQARQINNAAAARASGYLGSSAAWSGMINGLENSASAFSMMGKGGSNFSNSAGSQTPGGVPQYGS